MPRTLKNKRGPSKKKGGKRSVSSKKRTQTKKNQKRNLVNKKKRKGGKREPDSDDDSDSDVEPQIDLSPSSKNLEYLRALNASHQPGKLSGEPNKELGSRPTYMKMADE